MSRRSQNKTLKRGASRGISYKLRDKDAIDGRNWYIATQEWTYHDMEIDAPCRVFDLKFNGIHLVQVILKLWVVY